MHSSVTTKGNTVANYVLLITLKLSRVFSNSPVKIKFCIGQNFDVFTWFRFMQALSLSLSAFK